VDDSLIKNQNEKAQRKAADKPIDETHIDTPLSALTYTIIACGGEKYKKILIPLEKEINIFLKV